MQVSDLFFMMGRRSGKSITTREVIRMTEEMINTWKQKVATVIKANETKVITLNDWELSFIFNIEYYLNQGKALTMQQSISLNKIYGRIK